MRRFRPLAVLGLFLVCAGCCSLPAEALEAHRDAVKEEHLRYVNQDPSMSAEQRMRRVRTWQTCST